MSAIRCVGPWLEIVRPDAIANDSPISDIADLASNG
jgi:hypothetical protein